MSTQRYISTSFWDDEWIQELDPSEKLLYLYFMTNPLTNIAGVYKISVRRICFDTGFNQDTIGYLMTKFQKAGKAYRIGEYIVLPSWPKHQKWEKAPRIKDGIIACLCSLNEEMLHALVKIGYKFDLKQVFDTLCIPYTYPSNYSDSDYDSDNDRDTESDTPDKPAKRTSFQKPTLEEVIEYCKERGNKVIPEKWYNHYESNGWMVGKNKMKDWKAAVRTWEHNRFDSGSAYSRPSPLPEKEKQLCPACGGEVIGGMCTSCRSLIGQNGEII